MRVLNICNVLSVRFDFNVDEKANGTSLFKHGCSVFVYALMQIPAETFCLCYQLFGHFGDFN